MTGENEQYIRDNWGKSNAQLALDCGTSEASIRRARKRIKKPQGNLTRLQQILDKNDIDLDEIGSIKQVKLNEWQGMWKD